MWFNWWPAGTKPLLEPMLTYYQQGCVTTTWGQFHMWFLNHQLLIKAWKVHVSFKYPRGIIFTIPTIIYRHISGRVTGYPCSVWGSRLSTCLLYVCPFFYKSILNKLVCMLDRMGNTFALLCQYIWIVISCIYYHLSIPVRFILIYTIRIAFKLC